MCNLSKFIFLVLAFFAVSSANAFAPWPAGTWTGGFTSSVAACNAKGAMVGTGGNGDGGIRCYDTISPPHYYAVIYQSAGASCPSNATLASGSCSCNSGYTVSTAGNSCVVRATSPNGATAPVGPLGQAPLALAAAVALGLLGVAGAVLGAPLLATALAVSGLAASLLVASPLWSGGTGSPQSSSAAFSAAGSPLTVSLTKADGLAPGSSGSAAAVGVSTAGKFVPSGGGTSTGNPVLGGWALTDAAIADNWSYTPPSPSGVALPPVAVIADSGYTYAASTSSVSGKTSSSVTGKVYEDGSMLVTDARTVPVMSSSGSVTTADVAVSTAYGPSGVKLDGGTSIAIGPKLGNGTNSNGGDGLAVLGSGTGSGAGASGLVKIDETGTPAPISPNTYNAVADAFKAQGDSNQVAMADRGDKTFFSGWETFFEAPPVVACQPFVLPRNMGEISPCPVVSGMRSVMAYIWALAGLYLVVGMVRSV